MFHENTRVEIGSEVEKMQFANQVNGLVVKFIRTEVSAELDVELLVMERLIPLDYRAYEYEVRELWLDVFEDELKQLHEAGFVHRHLRRPSDMPGRLFDNVFLTETGVRLIDVGISSLASKVSDRLFKRFVDREWEEFEYFRKEFLSR